MSFKSRTIATFFKTRPNRVTWLVVQTKPKQEDAAELNLSRQGYRVFLPKLQQRKRVRGKWQLVVSPLFPRYLFIDVDYGTDDLAPVRSTVGVFNLVRFGQDIIPVPDEVVEFLQVQQDPTLGAKNESDWPHKKGDKVEILQGPFAGLAGVFDMSKDEERAYLFIELLGRASRIVVERSMIGDTIQI
jgi:transcriptional antiterminator RfaH